MNCAEDDNYTLDALFYIFFIFNTLMMLWPVSHDGVIVFQAGAPSSRPENRGVEQKICDAYLHI